MHPKPIHWTLTDDEFNAIKSQLNELGKMFLDNLRPNGFTKIKSREHWLSFRLEKLNEDVFIFIAFSLIKESPPEFELVVRKLISKIHRNHLLNFTRKKF